MKLHRHPMQPLIKDERGVIRFKENQIVTYLLEKGGIDLNTLAFDACLFPVNDWEQFYQLIGYSLEGFCEKSRVTMRTHHQAVRMANKLEEKTK